MHLIVNAVLLSLVLGVELASKIPIAAVRDCSARGFPRVRLETAPLRNRTHIALADLLDAVVSRNPAGVDHTSDVGALLDGRCVSVGTSFHGQDLWTVLESMHSSGLVADAETRPLFQLGAHYAYGVALRWAFALDPAEAPIPWELGNRTDELRISVHTRHFGIVSEGAAPAVEAASTRAIGERIAGLLRDLASPALPQCAILLASDRRLTLALFKAVAALHGCRLVSSQRGGTWETKVNPNAYEHGVDSGQVALRDVQLLSHGHVLIGSWGSTFTLVIQELIASRYRERGWPTADYAPLPTVTYCDAMRATCGPPLPLLVSAAASGWQVGLADFPRVRVEIGKTLGKPGGVHGNSSACERIATWPRASTATLRLREAASRVRACLHSAPA